MSVAAASTLAELAELVAGCRACAGLTGREHAVAGEFPPGARLLVVGEAPGAVEDRTGRPFVGRAGALLDELLAAAGTRREQVAVANVVKCRPPGNRTPSRPEARTCSRWLDRQLELAAPAVVVTLGTTAAAWLFGRPVRLADVRGVVHPLRGRRALASYHPSAALRFGPRGEPLRALRADLATAVALLREPPC